MKKAYLSFARYNQLMNRKLYKAAALLGEAERTADKGAFFKSVQNTLQHIMVADLVWLRRFQNLPGFQKLLESLSEYPSIQTLDQELFPNFEQLTVYREKLDQLFFVFVENLNDDLLTGNFKYTNIKGQPFEGELWVYVSHVFNHQTHHRGQATTLLTQMGIDVGVTDFPFVIRES